MGPTRPSQLPFLALALAVTALALLLGSTGAVADAHAGTAAHVGALGGVLLALTLSRAALAQKDRDRAHTAALEAANAALRQEIAERRRAEEVLRESEARLRALVHNFPNGAVFMFDHELRYLVADGQGLARAGFEPERIEGKTLTEVLRPAQCAALEPLYRAALAGDAPDAVESTHNDRVYLSYPVAVRGDSGRIVAGMVISIDVTEVRRAEEAQRRIEQKMHEAQRLESLGVLTAGIAHDFNNMLAAILAHAEVLRLDLPPCSRSLESVDAVIKVSKRASELVQQMLTYAGQRRAALQPLALNEVIGELGELLRVSLGKNARVRYDLAERLPAVEADASQIRQILLNLLVNASEALPPGEGGTITVSTALDVLDQADLDRLAPGADRGAGPYVRLSVADTGCGMAAETLARIFDPFFTTKFIGRGLGLAAVHGIVRSHRGALSVESAPGRGTTFHLWLPASEARHGSDDQPQPSGLG